MYKVKYVQCCVSTTTKVAAVCVVITKEFSNFTFFLGERYIDAGAKSRRRVEV